MAKTKLDWRQSVVPSDSFYVYQADLWCEDDGKAIRKDLTADGKAPEDPDDEASYDSDEFPKGPNYDDESDSPQHCAAGEHCLNAIELPYGGKVGQWLGNDLTSDGLEYVCKSARDAANRSDEHGRQVSRLWADLYRQSLDCENELVDVSSWKLKRGSPAEALSMLIDNDMGALNRLFVDANAMYGVGGLRDKPGMTHVGIWMSEALPDGTYSRPVRAVREAAFFEGREIQDALEDVIEEEGWRE